MPHAYTEDQLVEQPAIGLFDALGWETLSAAEETFCVSGMLDEQHSKRGRQFKEELIRRWTPSTP